METDNENLMITLRGGDSKTFHKNSRVTKVIVNEDPQLIKHNGKNYVGDKVLEAFTTAALEQSGEMVNIPGNTVSSDYVLKKETVMMLENVAIDDDTYFVEISKDQYKKLLSELPSGKACDIYGFQSEHIKYASEETNELFRSVINDIIKDISQLSDCLLSISLAKYIFKGKGRNPTLVKSYRRIQVGVFCHKMIQRHVSDQCTNVVKDHSVINQWGFKKGTSFLQCPLVRECLTKLAIEKKTPLYCVAADVASAFSRTNRVCQLFECSGQGEYGKLFLFTIKFQEYRCDLIL